VSREVDGCKVFVVGEGPNDIGWLARDPRWRPRPRRRERVPDEGFIPPVLRKVAREAGFELELDGRKLTSLPRTTRRRSGEPILTRRAHQALALARVAEAEAVVFVCDVDREQGRPRSDSERRQRMDSLRAQIVAGLAHPDRTPAPLIGTPSRMIEAWALGDPEALAEVADDGAEPAPARPEQLWGDKRDPESDYPKHTLERCLGRACTSDDLARLAEAADLDAVAASCPESFSPFLARARQIAADCSGHPGEG